VFGIQETSCIVIAGLLERDSFDLLLPEFDKPWVIHLRPCFVQVVYMGLLSIIPRGFGGNPCDTQSPWFYVILSHPKSPTQSCHFVHMDYPGKK
jgi:hypothetical protein